MEPRYLFVRANSFTFWRIVLLLGFSLTTVFVGTTHCTDTAEPAPSSETSEEPEPPANHVRALKLVEAGKKLDSQTQLVEAAMFFSEAARVAPDLFEARYWHAMILGQMKKYPDAEFEYNAAMKIAPTPMLRSIAMMEKGKILRLAGQLPEAKSNLQQAFTFFKISKHGYNCAQSLYALGMVYQEEGNFTEAIKAYRKTLQFWERGTSPAHQRITAEISTSLAISLSRMSQMEASMEAMNRALEIVSDPKVGTPTLHARYQLELARLYRYSHNYKAAVLAFQKALKLVKIANGGEAPVEYQVAALIGMAHSLSSLERYDEAEAIYDELLADVELEYGKGAAYANSLEGLSIIHLKTGRVEQGTRLLAEVMRIRSSIHGEYDEVMAISYSTLGGQLIDIGMIETGIDFYRRALEIQEAVSEPYAPALIRRHNELGNTLLKASKHTEAEAHLRITYNWSKKNYGEDHFSLSPFANNLGSVLLKLERTDEAEEMFKKAISVRPWVNGKLLKVNQSALMNLAGLYRETDRHELSNVYFKRGLDVLISRHGRDDLLLAVYHNNLAYGYQEVDDFDRAEEQYLRGIEITQLYLPQEELSLGLRRLRLAEMYIEMERIDDALVLLNQSLPTLEKYLPETHQRLAAAYEAMKICNQSVPNQTKQEGDDQLVILEASLPMVVC